MSMQVIQEKIEEVLNVMGLEFERVDVKKSELPRHLTFEIVSKDKNLLIGREGQNLAAFNTLLRQLLKTGETEIDERFFIDVGGYHASYIARLKREAHMMAERAISFAHSVEMKPMSAYERRLVHTLLEETPGVTTESEGEGQFRRVVIKVV